MAVKNGVVYVLVMGTLAPNKVHEVLLVDVQLRMDVVLYGIEDGDAERVTVGGDTTVTVLLWLAVPPAPVHVTV